MSFFGAGISLESSVFLLGFLPILFATFEVTKRFAPGWAPSLLLTGSLIFIASSDKTAAMLLAALTLMNFAAARAADAWPRRATWIRGFAIAAHLSPLILWKYFPQSSGLGAHPAIPLGLSFVAFMQISCLLDLRDPKVPRLDFARHALTSLFFGCVTAGPVTRYQDIAPQLVNFQSVRVNLREALLAGSLMAMGFAKVGVLGRRLFDVTLQVHGAVAEGATPTLIEAWLCLICGLLGIYFQFSGYSDVAIGLGLLFGLKLAVNFHSPLKARSASDFIERWHISLSVWVRVYLFTPLLKWVQKQSFGSKALRIQIGWSAGTIASLLAIGAWHGSDEIFILGGLIGGIAMVAGQFLLPGGGPGAGTGWRALPSRVFLLAMLSIFVAFSHAQGSASGWAVIRAAFDIPGLSAQVGVEAGSSIIDGFRMPMIRRDIEAVLLMFGGLLICLTLPNSMQIFEYTERACHPMWRWRPTAVHGGCIGALILLTLVFAGHGTGFFYNGF